MTLVRALVLVAFAAPPVTAAPVRGVALGLFAEDPGWSYRSLLDEIAATGADRVALVVAWYQDDAAAADVGEHPRFTAPATAIVRAMRDARAAGLGVTLFPIVRLAAPRSPDEWRGTLRPRDRAAWWRSYGARLTALARLGAVAGATELSIGSELSTLDGRADHDAWAALAADVRRVLAGRLSYSANWDHYRDVAIYDLVDDVGVCGYLPLVAPGGDATLDDLVRGWRDRRVELERFARAMGRPIVLTELGYRSVRGAAAAPWDEAARGAVDLDEQRRAYAAFRRVWHDAPPAVYGGVYFWNWYGWGGPTSRSYTPRGKPALDELRKMFELHEP